MSGYRGGWNYPRRGSLGYQLQFTDVPKQSSHVQACTSVAPRTAPDDDVWDEELPQDALHEALVLESQAVIAHQSISAIGQGKASASLWEASDDDLLDLAEDVGGTTRPSDVVSAEPPKHGGETSFSVNQPTDREQQYKLQGEMSLLRDELERRQREIDLLRRQAAEQTQQLKQQHEQQLLSLRRSLDALQADLKFKDHELTQANIKFRLNSPDPSPRRKIPRLSSSPGSSFPKPGFINREESCSRLASVDAPPGEADEQRSKSSNNSSIESRVPWCVQAAHALVLQVLDQSGVGAAGASLWITSEVTSAMSRLMDTVRDRGSLPVSHAVSVAAAMSGVCSALSCSVCLPFKSYLAAVQSIQTAHQINRRSLETSACSRQFSSAEEALVQTGAVCVSALQCLSTALSQCFTAGAPPVALSPQLPPLLFQMLRPCVVQNEVRNPIVMEYVFNMCAEIIDSQCTSEFVDGVLSVLAEVVNTRPFSGRLLSSLLQLLISLASAEHHPLSRLWCSFPSSGRTSSNSTCILKKLSILFNDGDFSDEDCTRYALPSLHSKAAASTIPANYQQDDSSNQVSSVNQHVPEPAVSTAVSFQFCRMVALVLSRESCRPSAPCCWTFLTVLAVRVMSYIVLQWRYLDDDHLPADCLRQLIASIHLLSSLNTNFSATVSKVRVHYLIAMETVSRCWQRFNLTPHSVELLRELYRFKSGL